MENLPKFETVGNASGEAKDKFVDKMNKIFTEQTNTLTPDRKANIEAANFPKTPEQISVLNFINEETNRLMVEAGLEPFDVSPEHFYIIPTKELKEWFDVESAAYDGNKQAVGVDFKLRASLFKFAHTCFHEMLHFKAKQVWEISKRNDKNNTQPYRQGVRVFSTSKKEEEGNLHSHFNGLNEAIVSWEQKLFFSKVLDLPELAEEKERQASEAYKLAKKKISKEKKIPEYEIDWIDPNNNEFWSGSGYAPMRRVLEYVCDEISKQFRDKYSTREDVFREFIKTTFTGNLLTIGRLVEKTFGEYAFRDLGDMQSDDKGRSANLILEKLQKKRRSFISQAKKV